MFANVRNLIAHALEGVRKAVLQLRGRVDPDERSGEVPWRRPPG